MRAIQRFGKQLQRLRTRRDRWPVAHVRDAAGTGTARPFVEHAGAIGEGAVTVRKVPRAERVRSPERLRRFYPDV